MASCHLHHLAYFHLFCHAELLLQGSQPNQPLSFFRKMFLIGQVSLTTKAGQRHISHNPCGKSSGVTSSAEFYNSTSCVSSQKVVRFLSSSDMAFLLLYFNSTHKKCLEGQTSPEAWRSSWKGTFLLQRIWKAGSIMPEVPGPSLEHKGPETNQGPPVLSTSASASWAAVTGSLLPISTPQTPVREPALRYY
ncbi:bone morphogenetic protein 15-like [Acinonyx jubatus]|uniref:Bone morphogenetic protein 15-like n=1 Tax=Acinonyx jubatus TaxID=32536 RepID=A0ABM3Q1Q6_ACIJB|nr:bone morphogenetic protein 15-like [Acinonyx jubatus]